MTLFSSVLHSIGCFIFFFRYCVAVSSAKAALPPRLMTAFTFTRHSSKSRSSINRHAPFQLQAESQSTKQSNAFFDLVKDVALGKKSNNENENIETVQDFDVDLANEIEEALMSVNVVDGNGDKYIDAFNKGVDADESTNESDEQIIPPPLVQNKAPKYFPQLPPHTPLAQVVANQYGFGLNDVLVTARGSGNRITVEDVEYHAWTLLQPPCMPKALELAYLLELDLNMLYDDEDREYVMSLSDIQLYEENLGSLKMTTVTNKGMRDDSDTEPSKKRMKKMKKLDERVEQNTGSLFQGMLKLAGTVAEGVAQQVQQVQNAVSAGEMLREAGVFDDIDGKGAEDINAVEDFDADLASEIEAALAGIDFGEDSGDDSAVEPPPVDSRREDINAVKTFDADLASEIEGALVSIDFSENDVNDSAVEPPLVDSRKEDMDPVEDFAAALASNIKAAFSSDDVNDEVSNGSTVEPSRVDSWEEELYIQTMEEDARSEIEATLASEIAEIEAALASEIAALTSGGDSAVEPSLAAQDEEDSGAEIVSKTQSSVGFTNDELLRLTCVQLKELLRQRGMKVSGKKAELVSRLINVGPYGGDGEKNDGSLFFAKEQ